MKKYLFMFFLEIALCGCDNATKEKDNATVYQCGQYEIEMTFSEDGDKLHAVINSDALDMENAVSASGARYVGVLNDTDVTLWGQGDNWILLLNDDEPIDCIAK